MTAASTHLVIADDHPLFRDALRQAVASVVTAAKIDDAGSFEELTALLEQDSDVVLLVHRPDLYEPETERAGEADLIIAKHRNGPTSTIAVAFQGRYSRFADMPH